MEQITQKKKIIYEQLVNLIESEMNHIDSSANKIRNVKIVNDSVEIPLSMEKHEDNQNVQNGGKFNQKLKLLNNNNKMSFADAFYSSAQVLKQ